MVVSDYGAIVGLQQKVGGYFPAKVPNILIGR